MQNLPNITSVEGVVVGSAMLVLWIAPAVLGWSDARRRRKVLAMAAAREAALVREAAVALEAERAREAALAREAELSVSPPAVAATAPGMVDLQLWDEPTVTVDLEDLGAPAAAPSPAAVSEVPVEPPAAAPIEVALPIAEAAAAPPIPEVVAAPPIPQVIEAPRPEPVSEPQPPAETPRFQFCLQELRRVRLASWPPVEVQEDTVRSEIWRDAERLAAERQREIGALPLASPHQAQSSCLGSAEADAVAVRLHFLLFPVLWPSTEEQATAEAVFEIDRASGAIRSHVNSLRRSS